MIEKLKNLSPKAKAALFLAVATLSVLVILGLIKLFTPKTEVEEPTDTVPAVEVQNYDTEGAFVPDIKRLALNEHLYQIIEKNLPPGSEDTDVQKLTDVVIRQDSVTSGLKEGTNVYWGRAIIDIASLKRSFGVYYEWSEDPNATGYSGYSSMAYCLQSQDLVYGEFDCKEEAWL
jgi:hypothetical protein